MAAGLLMQICHQSLLRRVSQRRYERRTDVRVWRFHELVKNTLAIVERYRIHPTLVGEPDGLHGLGERIIDIRETTKNRDFTPRKVAAIDRSVPVVKTFPQRSTTWAQLANARRACFMSTDGVDDHVIFAIKVVDNRRDPRVEGRAAACFGDVGERYVLRSAVQSDECGHETNRASSDNPDARGSRCVAQVPEVPCVRKRLNE